MKAIIANRFYYPDESATSRMVTSLARALAARGTAVHVVTSNTHHDRKTRESARAVVDGVTIHRIAATAFGRARVWHRVFDYVSFHWRAAWRVRRLVEPGDVVIVCTDPPLLSVTMALALWRSDAAMVNWLHDLFPEAAIELGAIDGRRAPARLLLWLRDWSLKRARCNVAPMIRMTELLTERGLPPAQLATIRHWSDGNEIRPVASESNALRREWGLADRFVVGYSGNFGRVHEFGTILDAVGQFRADDGIVFLFIGSGHRRAWFVDQVRRRGLTNVMMRPLQPRERLAESLSVADVHLISLLPHLETCSVPSKLYGILAAGRPVLFVGDTGGEVARTIRDAGCGLSARIGDSDRLAAHIRRLADFAPIRHTMARRARTAFETTFSEAVGTGHWRRLLATIAPTEGAVPVSALPTEDLYTNGADVTPR